MVPTRPCRSQGDRKHVYNAAHKVEVSKRMDKGVLIAHREDRAHIRMGPRPSHAQSGSPLESNWHKHPTRTTWHKLPARSTSQRAGKPVPHFEIEKQIFNPEQAGVKPDNLQVQRNLTG